MDEYRSWMKVDWTNPGLDKNSVGRKQVGRKPKSKSTVQNINKNDTNKYTGNLDRPPPTPPNPTQFYFSTNGKRNWEKESFEEKKYTIITFHSGMQDFLEIFYLTISRPLPTPSKYIRYFIHLQRCKSL